MRKLFTGAIILVLTCLALKGLYGTKLLSTENEELKRNQTALLDTVKRYKVNDSLNAVKAEVLTLRLDDYKKFRAEEASLISSLQAKLSEISRVIQTKTKSEQSIKTIVRDSIIRDTVQAVCFDYKSKWIDISGCVTHDSAELNIQQREVLTIVEDIKYKRFLGFLWKTNKIKSQTINVVSANPNTIIESVECIKIAK